MFHKAILLSGSVLSEGLFTLQPKNVGLSLARKLGYTGSDDDKDVHEFLVHADPIQMVEQQGSILEESDGLKMAFVPHIEPYVTETTFISKMPIELTKNAWGNDIDIMIGGTSHEGFNNLKFIDLDPTIMTELKLENMIPKELNLDPNDHRLVEFAEKIKETYFPFSEPKEDKIGYCKVRNKSNIQTRS